MKKNKKLCKVRPNSYIPSDLYPDILSRLPVKSLLRFRCVAKSWLAVVDDANFTHLHLKNFKNNETRLLAVDYKRQDCTVRSSDTFETITALRRSPISSDRKWVVSCSVDGLVLLRRCEIVRSSDLKLWNPSMRKFRQLPYFPKKFGRSLLYSVIGLGYDPLAKDYKIVLLVYADTAAVSSGTPFSVLIYTLGAKSWKKVEFQVKGGPSSFKWPLMPWPFQPIYFRGCLYSFSRENMLVVFDLISEVFSTIARPEFLGRKRLALVNGGKLLVMYGIDPGENSIWVLQTRSMSWKRRYRFRLNCYQILCLKDNGYLLLVRCRSQNIAAENWYQTVLYNPKTRKYKKLHEKRSLYYRVDSTCGYFESLILHK